MSRLRLFHFDIPTRGNYGDRVLFPYVRTVFESFGGGDAFEFVGTAPLRPEVSHDLVARINRTADAVVIGGGGLFLSDTNPNDNSGWQWNIAKDALAALDVPLIVFAVGDNRFPGQPAFGDLFVEHVAQTLDQSVFFGLRNTGSIRTIGDLLPEHRSRIGYQPCPTVLANRLHPHLDRSTTEHKVLAVQMLVAARQSAAGFSAEQIHRDVIDLVGRVGGAYGVGRRDPSAHRHRPTVGRRTGGTDGDPLPPGDRRCRPPRAPRRPRAPSAAGVRLPVRPRCPDQRLPCLS
ncbi:MAG: polysaccharide pyruvyl transferase family protein [Propionibacteriaceae bacterium]